LTGGLISGTGNITGGNLLTGGLISATGNIQGANIYTGGRLSVGTTSPTQRFVVSNAGADNIVMCENTAANIQTYMQAAGGTGVVGTLTNTAFTLVTNNTERMRIETGGNVGIGTSSPVAKLAVVGGTTNASNIATAYSTAAFNITPKSSSGYSLAFGSGPSDRPYIQMSAAGTAPSDILIQPFGGDVLFGAGISAVGQVIGATGVVANTVAAQGFGLRVVAATTDANATIQFTNTAQNAQWATITANAVNSLVLAATTTTASGSFVTPGTITVNAAQIVSNGPMTYSGPVVLTDDAQFTDSGSNAMSFSVSSQNPIFLLYSQQLPVTIIFLKEFTFRMFRKNAN
jgi:hypothetical protein